MLFLKLNIFSQAIRKLSAILCDLIYWLIAKIYELFITVARLNILSSDQIAPIYQRVTMILTIVMTFYITFEFVKYTIQPDTFTDKDKGVGNILQRVVIVVILIAFVPQIFSLAYKLQNRIIETQLISKIILGTKDNDYATYGNEFSANMLSQFYYYDEEACTGGGGDCSDAKDEVEKNLQNLRDKGEVGIASSINLASSRSVFKETDPAIKFTFDGILAVIVGAFIAYILVMYSIDVGTRYAQLIFLQVISPIAIMGYILPKKDGIFQKWGRQCITTYIDLFLRIAIIDFVLLIVKVLGDGFSTGNIFAGIGTVGTGLKTFTYIVLVMGLLVFAQRAPKLLGELFPSMGSAGIGFGLGAKNRIEPVTKAFKSAYKGASGVANAGARVAGGVGGAIAGARVGQGFGQRLRTAAAGAKSGSSKDNKGLPHRRIERAQEAAKQRQYKEDEIARNAPAGISREQAVRQATYHKEKYANIASEQDRQAKMFDIPKGSLDAINAQVDEFKQIKAIKAELKAAESRGASAAEIKTIDAKYKSACQAVRKAIVENNGVISDEMLKNGVKFKYNQMDDNGFPVYEYVEERDSSGSVVLNADGKPKMVIKRDTNGNPIVAAKIEADLRFDSGDRNFSGVVNRVATNELAKFNAAIKEMPSIGDILVEIGGEKKKASEWLSNPDTAKLIYAENANKFKDAMVEGKSIFENKDEYIAAHAYKDGIDNGGGKK